MLCQHLKGVIDIPLFLDVTFLNDRQNVSNSLPTNPPRRLLSAIPLDHWTELEDRLPCSSRATH